MIRISLFFLFLVAVIGTILRAVSYFDVPFEYMNLVHSHSHVAFQGWVYTIMFIFLTRTFLTREMIKKGRYRLQFILTVAVVFGVLISFALQGYGLYSIVFSTLFQLLNYWFIYRFFIDSKASALEAQNAIPLRFVKSGLWFGLLSTLMPIGVGVLSAKGLGDTQAYESLVYTFLHLQYNGWFLLVVLGLFYRLLEDKKIRYHARNAKRVYSLFSIAVIPSVSLSFLGMDFAGVIEPVAYVSSLLLAAGLFFFLRSISKSFKDFIRGAKPWFKLFLLTFLVSFALKTVLQSLSVLPAVRPLAFHNRFVIIAYLHLSLIGSISFLFFALLIDRYWAENTSWIKLGCILLFLGFLTTEVILSLTGMGLYFNNELLLAGSASMAAGILIFKLQKES